MKPIKKIAVLHDICGVGKAALTNIMPILGAMEMEACPIPTVLLSTHTGGYGKPAVHTVPPSYIKECADHYAEQQITFDLIFVGYLGTCEMAEAIEYFIRRFPGTKVILDPIMGDHGKYYSNFHSDYMKTIRKLLPLADLILPNFTEACLLADRNVKMLRTEDELRMLCQSLVEFGAKDIIITSIPRENEIGMVCYENKKFQYISGEAANTDYHGTGDVFSGIIAADYVNGCDLKESAIRAHHFIRECIDESSDCGYEKKEGLLLEKMLRKLV